MNRQRILLLESDGWIQDVLCELFGDEGLDVTLCGSFAELEASVAQYPQATVVSDSWAEGDYQTLSPEHRSEIVALASATEVVLTTGRGWAKRVQQGELGSVTIIGKPYDLNELMAAVRAAFERGSIKAHENARGVAAGLLASAG